MAPTTARQARAHLAGERLDTAAEAQGRALRGAPGPPRARPSEEVRGGGAAGRLRGCCRAIPGGDHRGGSNTLSCVVEERLSTSRMTPRAQGTPRRGATNCWRAPGAAVHWKRLAGKRYSAVGYARGACRMAGVPRRALCAIGYGRGAAQSHLRSGHGFEMRRACRAIGAKWRSEDL